MIGVVVHIPHHSNIATVQLFLILPLFSSTQCSMGQVCGCVFRVVGLAHTCLVKLQQSPACGVLRGSAEEYVHSPERHCAVPGPAAVCGPSALCGEPEGGWVQAFWLVQAGL